MKRFALLAGEQYYPNGWGDFKRFADTLEEASFDAEKDGAADWWEIVDLETGEIARSGPEEEDPGHWVVKFPTEHRSGGSLYLWGCACGCKWAFPIEADAKAAAEAHVAQKAEVQP